MVGVAGTVVELTSPGAVVVGAGAVPGSPGSEGSVGSVGSDGPVPGQVVVGTGDKVVVGVGSDGSPGDGDVPGTVVVVGVGSVGLGAGSPGSVGSTGSEGDGPEGGCGPATVGSKKVNAWGTVSVAPLPCFTSVTSTVPGTPRTGVRTSTALELWLNTMPG